MSAVSVLLAPRDEAFGERIAGALARRGLDARLVAGDQADLFIDGDLGNAASIVVWSNAALRLVQLHKQAREALENGALIPVSIGGAGAPDGFESLPPIDLSGWRGDDADPRWRFVLEAIEIASECRRRSEQDQWVAAQGATAPPADTVEPADEPPTTTPPSAEVRAVTPPAPSMALFATDTVSGRMPRMPALAGLEPPPPIAAPKKTPIPAGPPKPREPRFDPGVVAVAGVMILCLLTGATIILAPTRDAALPPAAPATSSSTPAFEPTPAPETPRIELAMLERAIAPRADALVANSGDTEPVATTKLPPVDVFADAPVGANDPYTVDYDNMEGYGEGDISYPDDFYVGDDALSSASGPTTDSFADEIHLAMLGPVSPMEIPPAPSQTPPPVETAAGATPRIPSLKPAAPTQAPTSIEAILASVPELNEEAGDSPSVQGSPVTAAEYFKDCAVCPDMVEAPAGAFVMGPGPGERARPNEGPARRVDIAAPFAIATREVTFTEWDACVADGGCNGYWAEDFGWGRGDQPVVGVSYDDARNYAAWLSEKTGEVYRLPSEAEWEFAARAGAGATFSFGEELTARKANYDARYLYRGKRGRWIGHPTPASRYPANGFGLFDMHGNVWEWTADCWSRSLSGTPADGSPRGGACGRRVLKGGAFNTGGWRLRAAHRIGKPAAAREMEIGFRVVRAPG